METRNSSNLHFIQAIRGALVTKVRNMDYFGKPGLVFKKLKDIYKSDGAKNLSTLSVKLEGEHADLMFDCDRVKEESPSLPVVETKTKSCDFNDSDTDNKEISEPDDSSFENMTLNQLKESSKTRKRKFSSFVGLTPKSEFAEPQPEEDDFKGCIRSQPEEDDSDLKETLSDRKKLSKTNKSFSTSCKVVILPISKCNLSAADCLQSYAGLPASVSVKTEAPEHQSVISMADDSSMSCNEKLDLLGGGCGEILWSGGTMSEKEEAMSFKGECEICVLNEVSNEYQECNYPSSGKTNGEETMETNSLPLICQQSSILSMSGFKEGANIHQPSFLMESAVNTTSPASDLSMDSCSSSQILFPPEIIAQMSNDSKVQVENDLFCMELKFEHDLETFDNDGHLTLPLNSNNNYDDATLLSTDMERISSNGTRPCRSANELPTSEINVFNSLKEQQTPERLLSMRKAISPSSQKKLCLAMNSIGLHDAADHLENKDSPQGLKSKVPKLPTNAEGSAVANQIEVTMCPKQIFKKKKNAREGCPLGPSVEGPNPLCRSLPHFSTGCSSIQGCFESAIEFSSRQMNDFESIAMQLLAELKSMKNFVEGKLLYEACRSNFLRHDAHEVKAAINNANKTEEKARKWLAIMARDCKRFCKIMQLTQDGGSGVEIDFQRERKKISFADETGGTLCHVKLFEDHSPESEVVNSILQEE